MSSFKTVSVITYYTLVTSSADPMNVNMVDCRDYITGMLPIALPSGGMFGGRHAYVHTGDLVKNATQRIAYIVRHGYGIASYHSGMVQCALHGTQIASLGHIFPRVYGGVFHPSLPYNIAPQCIVCNKLRQAYIEPIDVQWLQSNHVGIDYKI